MPLPARFTVVSVDKKLDTAGAVETATPASAANNATRRSRGLRGRIPRTANAHREAPREVRCPPQTVCIDSLSMSKSFCASKSLTVPNYHAVSSLTVDFCTLNSQL
jgi:hypothetical protein